MSNDAYLIIPSATRPVRCTCGRTIYWILHPTTGRKHPVTIETDGGLPPTWFPASAGRGISHFADCPDAQKHRKAGREKRRDRGGAE